MATFRIQRELELHRVAHMTSHNLFKYATAVANTHFYGKAIIRTYCEQ